MLVLWRLKKAGHAPAFILPEQIPSSKKLFPSLIIFLLVTFWILGLNSKPCPNLKIPEEHSFHPITKSNVAWFDEPTVDHLAGMLQTAKLSEPDGATLLAIRALTRLPIA
jgi:hypothetical protein